ncbi:hypothetical protein AAF712_009128 [Marasmius tenuissimus]|uniref:Uncharacterized protein n=1 Tax=Marasmius tenuissimus TaxID=585030 RepID=A0ABR2ZRA8_9AGAR|nr:hypothetical protein PM082_000009 [Marasmius tenuissimus]
MPKASKAKVQSAKSGNKHKVSKSLQPREDEITNGDLVDEYTHEAIVPPRRRPKSSTHAIQGDTNIEVQQKRPERATKKRAIEEKIWMDPQAGVPKGKGAADAHKALKRERALSNAESHRQVCHKDAVTKGQTQNQPWPSGLPYMRHCGCFKIALSEERVWIDEHIDVYAIKYFPTRHCVH